MMQASGMGPGFGALLRAGPAKVLRAGGRSRRLRWERAAWCRPLAHAPPAPLQMPHMLLQACDHP